MTSPGGRPVARVTVRVLPDSSGFDEQLRRELADLPDAKIDVGFNLDRAELRRELATLANEKVEIPVELDNRALQNGLEKALAGGQARPVTVPVEVDRDQVAAAIERAATGTLIDLEPVVSEDAINRSLTGTKILPIDVPVHADLTQFHADLAQAVSEAELAGRNPVLFKFDADKSALEREIAEVMAELQSLRTNGVEVELRARAEGIQSEIAKVEARLLGLKSQDWSIPVQMKIDEAQAELAALQAEMAGLDGETVRPGVELRIGQAQAELAGLLVQMEALDGRRAKFVAEADIETLKADAEIAAWVRAQSLRHKVTIPIDIDAGRASIAGAGGVLGALLPDLSRTMSSVGSAVQTAFQRVGSAIASAAVGITGFIRAAGPAVQIVAQVGLAIAQAGVYATALTVAGAGITAAYGAAATAITTLPALIGGAAAAAGVLALGFDGIKKAAEAINPALDKLTQSTSAIFEKGLTPLFRDLGKSLTSLKPQIDGIANSFVALAKGVTETVTSARGMDNIRDIGKNVADSLKDMRTGVDDIIAGFLEVGAQASVWDLVADSVNHFGETFRTAVTATVEDGSFDRAVTGLSGTIQRLEDSFVQLTTNGLRLFAGAAPGVNSFLDSLNRFFSKFDWEKLGGSVGKVFDGLGKALDKVDPQTFDRIEVAFDRLADVFQDPEFQENLANFIEKIPQLIGIFQSLVDKIGDWLKPISEFIDKVALFIAAWDTVWGLLTGDKSKIDTSKGAIGGLEGFEFPSLPGFGDGDGESVDVDVTVNFDAAKLTEDIRKAVQDGFTVGDTPPKVGFDAATLSSDIRTAVAAGLNPEGGGPPLAFDAGALTTQIREAIDGAFAAPVALNVTFNGAQGFDITQAINTMMANARAAVVAGFQLIATESVPAGMAAITNAVLTGGAAINAAWTALAAQWQAALTNVFNQLAAGAVPAGMALLTQAINTGLINLNTVWLTAVTNWNTVLQGAFLALQQTVTMQMALLQQSFANGWLLVQTAVTNAMLLVQQAVTNGMLAVQLAVTNGMLLVQQSFLNGWLQVQTAVTNAMLAVQLAVTNGMLLIQQAFTNGWLLVQQATLVAFQQITVTAQTAMFALVNAVNAGMALVVAAFTTQWLAANTATSAAMLAIQTVVTAGMAAISAAVTAGMTSSVNAMQVGWQQAATSAQTGMAQIVAAVTAGMAQIQAAVASGIAQIVASFASGLAQAVSTVVSGWAQITSTVISGMAQIASAVLGGVNQVLGHFRSLATNALSALRTLVTGAADIGRQIVTGLANAIRNGIATVTAAARDLAQKALAAAKSALGVSSPSKEFAYLGDMSIAGFVKALLAGGRDVAASGVQVAQDALKAFRGIEFEAPTMASWSTQFASEVDDLIAQAKRLQDAYSNIGASSRIPAGITASVSVGAQGVSVAAGPAQVQVSFGDVLVPDGQETAAAIANRMRRAAQLGIFG